MLKHMRGLCLQCSRCAFFFFLNERLLHVDIQSNSAFVCEERLKSYCFLYM